MSLNDELDFEQAATTDIDSDTDIDGTVTGVDVTGDIIEYTVVVTAIDPSGARGSGAIVVNLLNVDEAPAVTASGGATDNAATVVEAGTEPGEDACQDGTDRADYHLHCHSPILKSDVTLDNR